MSAIHDVAAAVFRSDAAAVEVGQVGWEDEDDYYSMGTDDDDGHTLVRVQLFRDRDITKPLKPDQAQGVKLICHINSLMGWRIPPKGTRVYVALPTGMEHVPGAGVIIAAIEKNPTIQYNAKKVKMDFGDDTDVVIKGRSVTLTDYNNQQVSLTPEGGVQVFDKNGAGIQFKDGAIYCTGEKYNLLIHDGTGAIKTALKLDDGQVVLYESSGTKVTLTGGNTTINTSIFTANYQFGFLGFTQNIVITDNYAQTGAPGSGGSAPTKSMTTWLAP